MPLMRCTQVVAKLASFVILLLAPPPAWCQLTTIINVPPATINEDTSIGPGTQANIFDGAVINRSLFVGGGELNVFGGRIDNFLSVSNSGVVNSLGGTVSFATVGDGGVVNISNGLFDSLRVLRGGVVNMSGGAIHFAAPRFFSRFIIDNGGVANISGGTFSNWFTSSGTVSIFGGEYRLDGMPISGLETIGNKLAFNVPQGSVLTGTFQDGTPFGFPIRDSYNFGTLNLEVVALPDATRAEIFASTGPVPSGIRDGQTLVVDNGSAVADHFRTGWGSAVRVETGGSIGSDFHALSHSTVNVLGGTLGDHFVAAGGS